MKSDALGDRMKLYEGFETERILMPTLPVIARLDGRAFHSFCKGLKRPYDEGMARLMIEVTKYLVGETGACMGYTQSDEITLAWHSKTHKSQVFFNGRTFKMMSTLAAMASVKFNLLLPEFLPEKAEKLPTFDCRVWNVPSQVEGANTFVWREWDATKNSISMAAQAFYSHKALHNKNSNEKQEMLFQKGVNWNDYPPFFKRGTFVQKKTVERKFTSEELEALPEKHHARQNPDLMVRRSEVRELDMPPISTVENRIEVIFDGAEPL